MKTLVVCALLVGCGSDGGGGSVEVDNLGMELAVASCAKQFDCCTDAEIMAAYMGITFEDQPITTEEQCVSFGNAILTSFAVARYKTSIAAGRMVYDGEAAAGCVEVIENATCTEYANGLEGATSGCRPFLLPQVADGGGCTQDYECTSDNCVGEMVPLDGAATDGMCQPMPTAGQPCDDNCATGLYCGFDGTSGMEQCQPLKTDGMQCNLDRECATEYCDDTTDVCGAEPTTCDGR